MNTIRLNDWETPATSYPRGSFGKAALKDWLWKGGDFYHAYGSSPPGDGEQYDIIKVIKRLKITTLEIDGQTWMVDDPPHWWTIQRHAKDYEGHVLVAGLGLGLIVHALSQNPKVTGITVVELEPDVISLVGPHVPACNIVRADWYEYEPDFKVGGVFYDLFVGDGRALVPMAIGEMVRLRSRFPGVLHRILGFHNEMLVRHAIEIEQAQASAIEWLLKQEKHQ